MTTQHSFGTLLLLAAFPIFLAGTPVGGHYAVPESDSKLNRNDDISDLKQELQDIQKKIRRRSQEELQRRKSQIERLDQLRFEERNQKRLNAAIQKQVSELESKFTESVVKSEEAAEEITKIRTKESSLKSAVVLFLEQLRSRIQKGIPWKIQERLGTLDTTLQLVNNEDTSAQAAIAAAGRMVKEQEALGRLIEFGIVEVEVDGKTRGIQGFHFGLLGVVFSDVDGNIFGWAGPGQSLESGLLSSSDAESSKGYLKAVDILQRRRAPSLVNLYIPSLRLKGE
ncbi:MAG: DUF3450 family protein [Planctomycetia bacterium]|nr:DUF3450 family protein [Planctomycetia bacterium]NCF98627.1 DUF3450 family protein [Planctomycetia bacterium]NCG56687.1 DUF3450 family protein [Pseudomonadota bacterium]